MNEVETIEQSEIQNDDLENQIKDDDDDNGEGLQKEKDKPESEAQEKIIDDLFGKPENYDFNSLELPEGVALDDEMTSEFKKIAEQMNLSQKGADQLMKLGVNHVAKVRQNLDKVVKDYVETRQKAKIEAYKMSLNSDKEVGGANLKQTLADANIAYDTFADDEVKEIFQIEGLNFCTPIVKMFKRIGEQLKDDTIHSTGGDKKQRTASDWFPSMKDLSA